MIDKKLKMIPLNEIDIQDPFWKEYMSLIRNYVIPYQWEALNDRIEGADPSYCMQNFRRAAGKEAGEFNGMVFQDSDVYKWLEAVAYSLMWHPNEELEKTADGAIDDIAAAQQPDGYIDTYYILNGLEKRFTNLMDHHELYCLGHMVEGAVAYYKATGKRKFLDVAIGYVNCVYENIGLAEGKKHGYPGHEVAEMALIGLYEITKDPKHKELAKYFIDQRGQEPLYFAKEREEMKNNWFWKDSYFQDMYYQAGKPVRDQNEAIGHAVRAVYLYSGMADVASADSDESLFKACERLWNNIVERQMYITGAIGSSQYGEAFTFDYDLPNDTIYGETCAAIGLVFFARRMLEITKDSRYADIMEKCLYNGVISGMSLDGKKFFYVNPLEVLPEASEKDYYKKHVKVERQKWFGCACCPPNVARLLSSIGGYAYERSEKEIYMNLFIGGDVKQSFEGTENVIHVETNYPWNGNVKVTVKNDKDSSYAIAIRVPEWCKKYSLKINGMKIDEPVVQKGYIYLDRVWKNQDSIEFDMDMPVQMMAANPKVREDIGKVTVMRGPIVYCIEEADNGDQLQKLYLKKDAAFTCTFEKDLLKGVMTITADGLRISDKDWDEKSLYQNYTQPVFEEVSLKYIPYYSWANRGAGEMMVWTRI